MASAFYRGLGFKKKKKIRDRLLNNPRFFLKRLEIPALASHGGMRAYTTRLAPLLKGADRPEESTFLGLSEQTRSS